MTSKSFNRPFSFQVHDERIHRAGREVVPVLCQESIEWRVFGPDVRRRTDDDVAALVECVELDPPIANGRRRCIAHQ